MKKNKQVMAVAILATLSAACCSSAADFTTNTEDSATSLLYRAHEFSIDAFGSVSFGQQTIDHLSGNRLSHDGRLGAGAGLNYFFCRHVGVGADAYSEDTTHRFIDSSSGNLILRLPIGETGMAPYIFGGGGYQFDKVQQGFGQAGAGIEFRFARHLGVFVDARYVIVQHTDNYAVGRAGLRFSF